MQNGHLKADERSRREREMAPVYAAGQSYQELAWTLDISPANASSSAASRGRIEHSIRRV
ncbi:MAG: hypothetical protein AAF458_12130 [Pseudomonadota bacterium]